MQPPGIQYKHQRYRSFSASERTFEHLDPESRSLSLAVSRQQVHSRLQKALAPFVASVPTDYLLNWRDVLGVRRRGAG